MNQINSNDDYSLLSEEKKAQIMNDLRKEIDKQKAQYSMNDEQFNDIHNSNNYNMSNLSNSNFVNSQPKYTYECNDEVNYNEVMRSESENEEEHLQILNNAKNVLNQIQDDINKFSDTYGIQQILPKNESFSTNNNPVSIENSHMNYNVNNNSNYGQSNNKEIYIDNNNYNEEEKNYNEFKYNNENQNYEENNYENSDDNDNNYNNNNDDDNDNYMENDNYNNYEENNNFNNNHNNNDDNIYNDNENENFNEINNISNKMNNISIKMNENQKEPNNTLFQQKLPSNNKSKEYMNINDDEYNNYLEEEQPRKLEYSIYETNSNYIRNNPTNSIQTKNSSKSKYNFENPLNYDKENMNFKKYSNYSNFINQKNKSFEQPNNKNDDNNKNINVPMNINKMRKTKSTTKPSIKSNNNKNINGDRINTMSNTNNSRHKNINKYNNRELNISNDNIYSMKNKEKFETMKKDLENKFAKEHPFKPKINKKYNDQLKNRGETEEERYNRLSRPRILDINEKKRIKDLEELKKISENNKIKPANKVNPKEVSNRLYNIHHQMKMKKDKIKQNYEETQNKEFSFTPEINNYSKVLMDKYQKKPIYERNEEFEKQKIDNIIRMRQEIEKEQKEKCKPLINEKSKKLALMNRNNNSGEPYEDVYERLYKENINRDTKSLGNREMRECTFAPKLNPMSNYLINNNYENKDNYSDEEYNDCNENVKDFLERQRMYEELKKEKLEKNKINNKVNYTFKPEINSNSDLLVKCNPDRCTESSNDKYSRLYQDAQRIKQKKEKLENELNNKYDFVPRINELSKYIGKKQSIEELNYVPPPKENQTNKKEEEEYDFKPQMYTNNKYKNIQSNYKNDNNMLERINEEMQNKNNKIKMMQKMKENKDIEQCNFTPEINKEMPDFDNNKPMYMKGMAKYLEQMEKARQAKRDKEQREKEVFITGEGWSKHNGITVPKPFKLSYQNNQKADMIKKEREKEARKECYFKPKTNESKNREIIKKLLNEN